MKTISNLSSDISELYCDLRMIRAVLSCFAGEYVDIADDVIPLAIRGNLDNYRALFDAICTLLNIADKKLEKLDLDAVEAVKAAHAAT